MKTVTLTENDAVEIYQTATDRVKKKLAEVFGASSLEDPKVRIKTFEDALAAMGSVPENQKILLEYNGNDADMLSAKAYLKLIIIARALNAGWKPDYSNSDEYKYYPWFKCSSGSGWSYNGCNYTLTGADVGPRLVFKTAELAKYAGTQFSNIYNEYLTTL